ncbi:MAG: insulinase family protein [Methylocystis sp.]|nr:insulinase family protein [Methylocystis sp.]
MAAKRFASSLPSAADICREVLPNGIIVLARANFSSPSVNVAGYLPAGALLETDDKLGLADFVASSLMRGTEFHTFDELYDQLESVGASAGFDSGVHNLNFGGRALAEDLSLLLKVISESLRFPAFPKDEVEKLRAQLLTGLALREQDTYDMASLHFDRMLFKDHPYGTPDEGSVDTIRAITRRDMQAFHRDSFGPKGMVVAIVEQATGLSEISSAVNDLDQVTQQNAALGQETSALATELARESSDLAGLVSNFKLNRRTVIRDTGAPEMSLMERARANRKAAA